QIDRAPTIVGRLGLDDGGRFFGQDLFGPQVRERAWIANYQEIGMLTPGEDGARDLVVLSPVRRVVQYRVEPGGGERQVPVDAAKADRAIADYQLADDLVRSGRYRAEPVRAAPGADSGSCVARWSPSGRWRCGWALPATFRCGSASAAWPARRRSGSGCSRAWACWWPARRPRCCR